MKTELTIPTMTRVMEMLKEWNYPHLVVVSIEDWWQLRPILPNVKADSQTEFAIVGRTRIQPCRSELIDNRDMSAITMFGYREVEFEKEKT